MAATTITSEISRISTAATKIKQKAADLGLVTKSGKTVTSSDHIEVQADAIENISKRTIDTTVTEPSGVVPIPRGYYDGNGSVTVAVPVKNYHTGTESPVGDKEASGFPDGDIFMVI